MGSSIVPIHIGFISAFKHYIHAAYKIICNKFLEFSGGIRFCAHSVLCLHKNRNLRIAGCKQNSEHVKDNDRTVQ